MAKPSLVDPDTLDLTRIVHGKETLRRYLKQRGRFEMLDAIVHEDAATGLIVGYQDLLPDAWWAADHIPGRPIFPGVLQLEGAAQLATYHFLTNHPQEPGRFVGFGGMNETRFRGVVTPPARLILVAKQIRVRATMFTYAAQGFVDGKLAFETEILGVVV